MYYMIDRGINIFYKGARSYTLGNLASHRTTNLLKKKYLNKLILKYVESNFLSLESPSIKLKIYSFDNRCSNQITNSTINTKTYLVIANLLLSQM